jgi:hypothetical protein
VVNIGSAPTQMMSKTQQKYLQIPTRTYELRIPPVRHDGKDYPMKNLA